MFNEFVFHETLEIKGSELGTLHGSHNIFVIDIQNGRQAEESVGSANL